MNDNILAFRKILWVESLCRGHPLVAINVFSEFKFLQYTNFDLKTRTNACCRGKSSEVDTFQQEYLDYLSAANLSFEPGSHCRA